MEQFDNRYMTQEYDELTKKWMESIRFAYTESSVEGALNELRIVTRQVTNELNVYNAGYDEREVKDA